VSGCYCFQTFYEGSQSIFNPLEDFDPLMTPIDEYEVITESEVTCEFGLNYRVQAIVRSTHIDGLHLRYTRAVEATESIEHPLSHERSIAGTQTTAGSMPR
jgi:hypothetical protein